MSLNLLLDEPKSFVLLVEGITLDVTEISFVADKTKSAEEDKVDENNDRFPIVACVVEITPDGSSVVPFN